MAIEVSVIVPTYNGEKKIFSLLNSLAQQSFQNFEVVVVIDGSTDNTESVIREFNSTFQTSVVKQPNLGRAAAKNSGAQHAKGEVLIFFDDDMAPENDAVIKHLNFHAQHFGILSGNSIEKESEGKTDIQNYKASLTSKWTEKYFDGLNQLTSSNLFFTSANCSVAKTTLFKLNFFDSRLTDAEDYDLACRAIEQDVPVFFDKSIAAEHHEKITCKNYILRLRAYRNAQFKLAELHPERHNIRLPSTVHPFKKFQYWFFTNPFLVKWIDEGKLKFLPKFIRYKIYEVTIHSFANVFPDVAV